MNKSNSTLRRRRTVLALLSAAALAVTGLVMTAVPASAVLTQGPGVTVDGLPASFHDSQGLAVAPCDAGVALCGGGFNPADATYFSATTNVGPIKAVYALTAGVAPPPEVGVVVNQVNRFDARRGALAPGTYRIQDPWGTTTCLADANGMNCRDIRVGTGRISSLLRAANPPAGFLGNGAAGSAVTGSPTGFNKMLVTGPGGFRATTGQFIIIGQLLPATPMTLMTTKALSLGSAAKATPSTANIAIHSVGTAAAPVSVAKGGTNPGDFALVNNCAPAPVGTTCRIGVTYTPRANRNASAVLTINDGGLAAPRRVALTGVAPDTLAPRVLAKSPAANSTGVATARSVNVKFNEPVGGVNKLTFTLTNNHTGNHVNAKVSQVRKTNSYMLNPTRGLDRATSYTVKLNGGRTGIADLAGNAVADTQWRFRTH
jgi:hypothetical protein